MLQLTSNENDLLEEDSRQSSGAMRMDTNPALLKTMVTKNYQLPFLAAVREPLANAAPNDSGGTKSWLILEPNRMIIKDNGRSMSPEFMLNDFATAGRSTKNADNKSTGGFGIGRLAITVLNSVGEFKVKTVTPDSIVRNYLVSIEKGCRLDGTPYYAEEEECGTEIEVEFTSGFDEIEAAAKHCTATLNNELIIKGSKAHEEVRAWFNRNRIYESELFDLYSSNPFKSCGSRSFISESAFYLMGGIAYPIDENEAEKALDLLPFDVSENFVLIVKQPIGSVDISISREGLYYDAEGNTVKHLKQLMKAIATQYVEDVCGQLVAQLDSIAAEDKIAFRNLEKLGLLYQSHLNANKDSKSLISDLNPAQALVFAAAEKAATNTNKLLQLTVSTLLGNDSEDVVSGYSFAPSNSVHREPFVRDEVVEFGKFFGVVIEDLEKDSILNGAIRQIRSHIRTVHGAWNRRDHNVRFATIKSPSNQPHPRFILYKKLCGALSSYMTNPRVHDPLVLRISEIIELRKKAKKEKLSSSTGSKLVDNLVKPRGKPAETGIQGQLYTVSLGSIRDFLDDKTAAWELVDFSEGNNTDSKEVENDPNTLFVPNNFDDWRYAMWWLLFSKACQNKVLKIFVCPSQWAESKRIKDEFKQRTLTAALQFKDLIRLDLPSVKSTFGNNYSNREDRTVKALQHFEPYMAYLKSEDDYRKYLKAVELQAAFANNHIEILSAKVLYKKEFGPQLLNEIGSESFFDLSLMKVMYKSLNADGKTLITQALNQTMILQFWRVNSMNHLNQLPPDPTILAKYKKAYEFTMDYLKYLTGHFA